MSLTYPLDAHAVKKGTYVMLKGCPVKINDVKTSKTGKHGSAKCNMTGNDVLTGRKYNEVHPGHIMLAGFDLQRRELEVSEIDEQEKLIHCMDENGAIVSWNYFDDNENHQELLERFRAQEAKGDSDDNVVYCTIVKAPRGEGDACVWDEGIMSSSTGKIKD